jgi:pyruvate dehydrogenase E2 component (dihydrolipoamide acetyltransferase)
VAAEVVMPRLGWSMEAGTLVEWCKPDGSPVRPGEVVCIIESDKAEQEVECFDSGILRIPPDSPPPGTKVPVGTLLAYILAPGESLPSRPPGGGGPPAPAPAIDAAPGPRSVAASRPDGPRVSPRARRVAAEMGVEWARLTGSGRTGRIIERDVRAAAAAAATRPAGRVTPLRSVRRLVAERMSASARTVASVTLTTEADATALVRLRAEIAADLESSGAPVPSYTDLIVKLTAAALLEHPALNASLVGEAIVQHAAVHVGVAVDTERGLVVPVLRDVSARSLRELAAESAARAAAARAGTISPDDLRGATFTVTNLGMYEIDAFTPLVNLPECAVLGVGRIVARPVVVTEDPERIAVHRMLTLSLTFDHRLVDGAPAARFLQRVKQYVERPHLWLTR